MSSKIFTSRNMIAENSVLSTSSWQNDVPDVNINIPELNDMLDVFPDLGELLDVGSDYESETSWADFEMMSGGLLPDIAEENSLMSSIVGDDFSDVNGVESSELININNNNTDNGGSLGEVFDHEPSDGCMGFFPGMNSGLIRHFMDDAGNERRHRAVASILDVRNNIKWNDLSVSEQMSTVEDLIQFVSNQLDLRQQLEFLRIIARDGSISPTNLQTARVMDMLNMEKFEKIKQMIAHNQSVNGASQHQNTSTHTEGEGCKERGQYRQQINDNSPKLTKKQKQSALRLAKERQKKERKQIRKEKRSGLFLKEEVITLTTPATHNPGESSDIDIDDI